MPLKLIFYGNNKKSGKLNDHYNLNYLYVILNLIAKFDDY